MQDEEAKVRVAELVGGIAVELEKEIEERPDSLHRKRLNNFPHEAGQRRMK